MAHCKLHFKILQRHDRVESLRKPYFKFGEMPEWLNGTVSKTVVGLVPTVGSNPTLSAAYQP